MCNQNIITNTADRLACVDRIERTIEQLRTNYIVLLDQRDKALHKNKKYQLRMAAMKAQLKSEAPLNDDNDAIDTHSNVTQTRTRGIGKKNTAVAILKLEFEVECLDRQLNEMGELLISLKES